MKERFKKLNDKLSTIYGEFESVLGDETVSSLPEVHEKIVNKLGDVISELETLEEEIPEEGEED